MISVVNVLVTRTRGRASAKTKINRMETPAAKSSAFRSGRIGISVAAAFAIHVANGKDALKTGNRISPEIGLIGFT